VTGAGPAVEFCDARTAYLVPARPARLPGRRVGDIETVDFPWVFEPDAGALRALLRHAAGHPGEVRAKGRAAAAYARERLSWDRAADAVEGRLRGLRGRPVRRLAAPAPAPAAPRRRARVSLVMMVRDEEKNLPDCLGPAAGLFDEVVVVDTGSADGTKAVAAALGARVFDFPWADSFSAARNEGLRHATGDWAFWLDADDRLDAPNLAGLRALFDGLGGERAAYVMKCRCVPDGPGGSATVVDHLRLFRNDPALRWDYRVHEQILPAVRRAGHEVRRAGVVIDHVGYTDPALRRRKLRRDLRLLRLEEVERPGDPFTQFNLGSVHHELGEPAEAVACLRRSLARSHPSDSIVRKLYALIAHCHRQQGRGAEALAACAEGRRHYPDDAELLFVEAQARRDAGDAAGAEVCLRRLLGGGDDPHFASVDDGLRGHKGRQNLASLLYGQGRHREAEALWREALAGKPGFAPAALGLGELYAAQGRWPDLARLAAGLGAAGAGAEAAVLAAQGHLARGEFGAAREALAGAIARHPRALLPRVALGRALLREGRDAAAAARALRDVLALDPGNAEARRGLEALGGYGAAGPTPGAG
jgi:tetratricopeptide (TPR) repeat protein